MNTIDRIIKEEIEKHLLKEAYIGDLYHFTSIGLAYDIMQDNVMYAMEDSSMGNTDRRMEDFDNPDEVVSLSRNGTFGAGFEKNYGISVRFTLDGDKLSSSLRGNRIHPYNYGGFDYTENNYQYDPEDPNSSPYTRHKGNSGTVLGNDGNYRSTSEFEERLYGNNIYPLDKYCTRIDILVRDLSSQDDSDILSDEDYDYVPTYDGENDEEVNKWLLDSMQNMPRWKGKVFVHYADKKIYSTRYEKDR